MKRLTVYLMAIVLFSSMLINTNVANGESNGIILPYCNISFGTPMEQVLSECTKDAVVEENSINDTVIYAEYPYQVLYSFKENMLSSVKLYTYDFASNEECEDKYNKLNMAMMDAYGVPSSMDDSWGFYAWKPMYQDQMGKAMLQGFVTRTTVFDVEGMDINIKIGPDEKTNQTCLQATIKVASNVQFDLDTMKSAKGYSLTVDEVSGNAFFSPDDTKSFQFTDKYSLDYYSTIYPDVIAIYENEKYYPIFRLWIYYRVTDALWIGDININMGDTTWTFTKCNIDYPEKISGTKKYQTVEKGLIKFDKNSVEFLDEFLEYNGTVIVTMTSSNSTSVRKFEMPSGTQKAIKSLYSTFKEANGTEESLLEHYNGNKSTKKKLKQQ